MVASKLTREDLALSWASLPVLPRHPWQVQQHFQPLPWHLMVHHWHEIWGWGRRRPEMPEVPRANKGRSQL